VTAPDFVTIYTDPNGCTIRAQRQGDRTVLALDPADGTVVIPTRIAEELHRMLLPACEMCHRPFDTEEPMSRAGRFYDTTFCRACMTMHEKLTRG
jgi:hypothetical protein